jgi:hypothetical protein
MAETKAAMDAWRRIQHDRRLAEAIRDLLRTNWRKPPGWLRQSTTDTIEEDAELTAFFRSVAVEGEEAWKEKITRIRRRQVRRRRWRERQTGKLTEASPEISVIAIIDLMPIWRRWGSALMDMGVVPES